MGEELSLVGVKVDGIKQKTAAAPKPTVAQAVLVAAQKCNGATAKLLLAKCSKRTGCSEESDAAYDASVDRFDTSIRCRLNDPNAVVSHASSRLLRRSKSLGIKVRKTNYQETLSNSLRNRSSSNQNISKNKQSTPENQNRYKTELPSLSLEKSKRVSIETAKNLEIDKMTLKCQQRREIYALNREMKKIENESFQAFMSQCGNDIPHLFSKSCDPLDKMLMPGGRV